MCDRWCELIKSVLSVNKTRESYLNKTVIIFNTSNDVIQYSRRYVYVLKQNFLTE